MGFEDLDQSGMGVVPEASVVPAPEKVGPAPEELQEYSDRLLIEQGLNMTNLYIKSMDRVMTAKDIKPGTYNRNQGVLICNVGGTIMALPDTERTIGWVEGSRLRLDESVEVPHLNEKDVWGSEEERNQNTGFRRWLEINQ